MDSIANLGMFGGNETEQIQIDTKSGRGTLSKQWCAVLAAEVLVTAVSRAASGGNVIFGSLCDTGKGPDRGRPARTTNDRIVIRVVEQVWKPSSLRKPALAERAKFVCKK